MSAPPAAWPHGWLWALWALWHLAQKGTCSWRSQWPVEHFMLMSLMITFVTRPGQNRFSRGSPRDWHRMQWHQTLDQDHAFFEATKEAWAAWAAWSHDGHDQKISFLGTNESCVLFNMSAISWNDPITPQSSWFLFYIFRVPGSFWRTYAMRLYDIKTNMDLAYPPYVG